jgi:hypothetical protein
MPDGTSKKNIKWSSFSCKVARSMPTILYTARSGVQDMYASQEIFFKKNTIKTS